MSTEFYCSRTPINVCGNDCGEDNTCNNCWKSDLHPTDIEALKPFEYKVDAGYIGKEGFSFGTTGTATMLYELTGIELRQPEWIEPTKLLKIAERLANLKPYLREPDYVNIYIKLFVLLGNRGIGIQASY